MSDSRTNSNSESLGRLFDKIRPETWGFIASGILLAFVLSSCIGYVGTAGESYSLLNHYISELGQVGVSHLAPLFNTGLILGGFASAVFMVGLGRYIKNTAAKIAMGVGVFAGISCSIVGFFPMNNLHTHNMVAKCFFFGRMIAVVIFSVAILRQRKLKIPKLFSIAGVVVAGVFIAFIVDAFVINPGAGRKALEVGFTRPHIWWCTILEWSTFFAIVGWMLLISICMYVVNRKSSDKMGEIQS